MNNEGESSSDHSLLLRCNQGDEAALGEVLDRYVHRLLAFADRRIHGRLGRRLDAEDVVQSACFSFFRNAKAGRYTLERGGELWQLLVGITAKKLYQQVERHGADKRDFAAEQSMWIRRQDGSNLEVELADDGPSPDDAAALLDELDQILSRVPELHRQIIEARLRGGSIHEVALEVKRSERTVRRALEMFREMLQTRFAQVGIPSIT